MRADRQAHSRLAVPCMVPSPAFLRVAGCAQAAYAYWQTDMNSIRILLAVLLLASSSVRADTDADLRALVAEYDRAYLAADVAAVGTLLAADYRVVVEGRVRDRDAVLKEMTAPERDAATRLNSTVDRVWADGDLAVATGRIEWRAAESQGSEHFTLVARREGGKWRVASEHLSDVARDAGN